MDLPWTLILFYAFAAVLVVSALGVISVKNSVHAALLLVLCFFTTAALWLLLQAEFLAVALVLVYVGAVMVLFLFVVMMLDIKVEPLREGFIRYLPIGLIVAMALRLADTLKSRVTAVAEIRARPMVAIKHSADPNV